jgi:hypothetical protein
MRFRPVPSVAHSIEGSGNAAFVAISNALLLVFRSLLRAGRGCFLERPETVETFQVIEALQNRTFPFTP